MKALSTVLLISILLYMKFIFLSVKIYIEMKWVVWDQRWAVAAFCSLSFTSLCSEPFAEPTSLLLLAVDHTCCSRNQSGQQNKPCLASLNPAVWWTRPTASIALTLSPAVILSFRLNTYDYRLVLSVFLSIRCGHGCIPKWFLYGWQVDGRLRVLEVSTGRINHFKELMYALDTVSIAKFMQPLHEQRKWATRPCGCWGKTFWFWKSDSIKTLSR